MRGLGRFFLKVVMPIVLVLGAINLASMGLGLDFDTWLEEHSVLEIIGSVIAYGVMLVVGLIAAAGTGAGFAHSFGRGPGRGFFGRLGAFLAAVVGAWITVIAFGGVFMSCKDALTGAPATTPAPESDSR